MARSTLMDPELEPFPAEDLAYARRLQSCRNRIAALHGA